MPIVSASIDTFLLASLVTVVPWALLTLARLRRRVEANEQTATARDPQAKVQTSRRTFISVFIAIHTLYILYNICVLAPSNLFTSLRVPLNEPADSIRARFLHLSNMPVLPEALGRLFTRLQSFEARIAYVRFGHSVLQECEHCSTYDDFALYALPGPLLEYVRQAAVIGVVTIRDSGRERWRYWGLAAVAAAALSEAYFILSAEVKFSSEGGTTLMLHDIALFLRHLFIIILPALLHVLPPAQTPLSPLSTLPQLAALAERTADRLQLLKYTIGAQERVPALRDAASAWWADQRAEGTWALHDPALREMANRLNTGVDEGGQLRTRARTLVDVLKGGFRPPGESLCSV